MMSENKSHHVFWLIPMPGVAESNRVVVTDNQFSVIVLLPDNTQIIITADRAVYVKDERLFTLSQWQSVPVPAGYEVSEVPPELPDSRAGTFTLGGRRTYGD
jgi:hypothetical protein